MVLNEHPFIQGSYLLCFIMFENGEWHSLFTRWLLYMQFVSSCIWVKIGIEMKKNAGSQHLNIMLVN